MFICVLECLDQPQSFINRSSNLKKLHKLFQMTTLVYKQTKKGELVLGMKIQKRFWAIAIDFDGNKRSNLGIKQNIMIMINHIFKARQSMLSPLTCSRKKFLCKKACKSSDKCYDKAQEKQEIGNDIFYMNKNEMTSRYRKRMKS